jgi:hypothetical protein
MLKMMLYLLLIFGFEVRDMLLYGGAQTNQLLLMMQLHLCVIPHQKNTKY